MSLKHTFDFDPDHPFKNDKLEREEEAKTLTSLVQNYSDGFVLAINNEWGAGKTTFLKMWQAHLGLQGVESLYFNAWENDHQTDVLVALLSELKELENKDKADFKEVVKKAGPIAGQVALGALKGLVATYGLDKVLQGAIEGAIEGGEELLKSEIETYSSRKKGLQDFKDSLEAYAAAVGGENPLVFVIDELDRCRPSYAVEVLEQIKHVFSVSGIVFVLAIDKKQLGHAIKGVYGSPGMDDVEYLRRFIDVEYSMPIPSREAYADYLYDYYDFDQVLKHIHKRVGIDNFGRNIKGFLSHFSAYFNLNARKIERLCAHLKISFSALQIFEGITPTVYLLLAALKMNNTALYDSIKLRELSTQELIDKLANIIPSEISLKDRGSTVFSFVFLYHNDLKYYNPNIENLLRQNDIGENELNLDFKHFVTTRKSDVSHLQALTNTFNLHNIGLSRFIANIEMSQAYLR